MNGIKFRAWDKVSGCYDRRGPFDLTLSEQGYFGDCVCGNDDYVLEQFTGMVDCDGKDIYDGDILKLPKTEEVGKVVFSRGSWAIYCRVNEAILKSFNSMNPWYEISLSGWHGQAYIAGNINENTELMGLRDDGNNGNGEGDGKVKTAAV